MHHLVHSSLLLITLALTAAPASAQEIPVTDGRFAIPANAADGTRHVPGAWSVTPRDAEVTIWRPDDAAPPALRVMRGGTIQTTVDLPALTEKEAKAGSWRLAVLVDLQPVGRAFSRPALSIDGTPVAEAGRVGFRLWYVLGGAEAAPCFGRTVELALTAGAGTAFEAVRLFRLPDAPTRTLLGKANGKLGPDALAAAAYGFDALMVHGQPALAVMTVRDDSPAQRAGLAPGDAIIAIEGVPLPDGDVAPGWNWYERGHEALLGRRALAARAPRSARAAGTVKLDVLRGTTLITGELTLPRRPALTTPVRRSGAARALRRDLIERIVATQREDGSWKQKPIHTAFGGLALLSTGDDVHAARIRAAADWCLARIDSPQAAWFWQDTYLGIFLCEYHLATGDDRVLPAIAHQLEHIMSSTHTSKWDTVTLGHGPKGLPYGNKSLVALTAHILVFEALAERCGVEGRVWAELEPYMLSAWSDPEDGGHGGLGYNASHKDQAEFWSRSGLFALALHLRDEHPRVREGLVGIMQGRHPWFRNSHAYGEPGGAWGLIALAAVAPDVHDEVLDAYAWWFAGAWRPGYGLTYTTPHMGAPYMEGDVLINNAYAVVLTAREARLAMTGRSRGPWLDVSALPVAASAVHIQRTKDGAARLAAVIPGGAIHYTTDGSEPTPMSRRYEGPFPVEDGITVKARAFGTNDAGPVAARTFGFADRGRVIAATGHADPGQALARAARVLDGNDTLYWVTSNGKDARSYPFELTIDLGRERVVRGVRVHLAVKDTSPRTIRVHASRDPDASTTPVEFVQDAFAPDVRIDLPETTARYVRIEFDEPMKDGVNVMMVGEIEVY